VQKRLVLLGGGHAHLSVLANLRRFTDNSIDVVVVQPARFHYYSGMGPGMLGSTYEPDQIRFDTQSRVEQGGGTFLENRAVRIVPEQRTVILDDNTSLSYDALSCNTGSEVPDITGGEHPSVITAKPIAGLIRARTAITDMVARNRAIHIGIIGGGPSAVELACNVRQLAITLNAANLRITLFAGRSILTNKPPRLQHIVRRYLTKRAVILVEGTYADVISDGTIRTASAEHYSCDLILVATGVNPSPLYHEAGLSREDGIGLAVNEYLQSPVQDTIFGGGDCIDFVNEPLDKVGVYAVRQNPILLHNLHASLTGKALQSFSPGGSYLLIYNLGCGHGVFMKGPLIFSGLLAFRIKDFIDRRFMRRYQN